MDQNASIGRITNTNVRLVVIAESGSAGYLWASVLAFRYGQEQIRPGWSSFSTTGFHGFPTESAYWPFNLVQKDLQPEVSGIFETVSSLTLLGVLGCY